MLGNNNTQSKQRGLQIRVEINETKNRKIKENQQNHNRFFEKINNIGKLH